MRLREHGLTWHVVGDEVVVLDIEGSVYLRLNDSARLLWTLLDASCDGDELAAVLMAEYDLDWDKATADVSAFLDELRQRSLLAS